MSATGRGAVRKAHDGYSTPRWCVDRLLERVDLPGGHWLEPAAGNGAIIGAVLDRRSDVTWSAAEVQPECEKRLADYPLTALRIGDFLDVASNGFWPKYDVAITNPPFFFAKQFVQRCQPIAKIVVMLLRVNFLASEKRHEWLACDMPDVYMLPNRPPFLGDGKTDATEYCWAIWYSAAKRRRGSIEMLELTTPTDRKARR